MIPLRRHPNLAALESPRISPPGGRDPAATVRGGALLLLWIVPVAVVAGSASALFLRALDAATVARFEHPWLLYLLPVAGLLMGLAYHRWGASAEAGNNLIFDQIHDAGEGVPGRMAPMILLATVLTHLCGGSAGREGTAVQMGGSIAGAFGRLFRLDPARMRLLLMAGVAAGFGAVFGTPLAGAVFALEVVVIGRMRWGALLPCLVAGFIADRTCLAWGAHHMEYAITSPATGAGSPDWLLLAKVVVIGAAAGLASALFSETTHLLQAGWKRWIPRAPLRPFFGGIVVIALVGIAGTREYLGLGVSSADPEDLTIAGFFIAPSGEPFAWAWKILFTAVTLSAGFKGGEVTPLFFIGAALGNALAVWLGAPVDLCAALGFVAIFAGATHTPIASTILGIELFGLEHGGYLAVACLTAFFCSGHSGIYLSQRLGKAKLPGANIPPGTTLRQIRGERLEKFRRRFAALFRKGPKPSRPEEDSGE